MRRKTWLIDLHFAQQLKQAVPYVKGLVLDVGCGDKPFEQFFTSNSSRYIGVDLQSPRADVIANALRLPFADSVFDTVVCFQVLDDFTEPIDLIREMARVLRPGGALLLSVNQSWRVHNPPTDFYRFTPFGLRYLFAQSGLSVLYVNPMGGLWALIATRVAFRLHERMGHRRVISFIARCLASPVLGLGRLLDRWDWCPEDTQNNFAVGKKHSDPASI